MGHSGYQPEPDGGEVRRNSNQGSRNHPGSIAMLKQAKKGSASLPTGPLYLEGYLTKLFDCGEEPRYGYPKNHLPPTSDEEMEVVTGYLAAQ